MAQTRLSPPPLPDDFLARPRLLDALQLAIGAHRLTLISAPAGSGKTTLAAACAQLPRAWLSLDEVDNDPPHFLLALGAALERLALGRPLYDRLQRIAEAAETPAGNFGLPVILASSRGLLALAEGRVSDAVRVLERAARLEDRAPFFNLFGSARTLLAYAYLQEGREREALAAVSAALGQCREQGAPGRLLLEGRVAASVLELAVENGLHVEQATGLLQRLGAAEPRAVQVPDTGETLTPREVQVLGLLLGGASNQEIADELVISIHTAKRHVSHILAKLDVSNRTEAAARARELGLRADPPHK